MDVNRAAAPIPAIVSVPHDEGTYVGAEPVSAWLRNVVAFGADVALLGLMVVCLPLVILLLGLPIAGVLWGLLQILERLT